MAADEVLYCTELVGLSVFDTRGKRIGRVKDAAIVPLVDPSRVDRFLIGGGWAWLTVRHDQVRAISAEGIYLRDEQLTPYHADEYMLRIVRDLLDQQIIDVNGRKVVRVNDVTFEHRSTRRPRRAARARSRHRRAQHLPPPVAGRAAAALDPPAAAAAFRRTPSAGSSATSSSPTRSAGCG